MKKVLFIIVGLIILLIIIQQATKSNNTPKPLPTSTDLSKIHIPTIAEMRQKSYPGSQIVIERTVANTSAYMQYVTSYRSDGLKIYALLTVPKGQKPVSGWPVVIFNHGYVPPKQFTQQNDNQIGAELANQGFLAYQPSFRGNAGSDGDPNTPDGDVIDDLNAISSIRQYPEANPQKVGVWGHSNGGGTTLNDLVINPNIQAAVLWSGQVGSISDQINYWKMRQQAGPLSGTDAQNAQIAQALVLMYGTPDANPQFYDSIDPVAHISEITTPIQIQVGTSDAVIPWQYSKNLDDKLQNAHKTVEFYSYPGDDHLLTHNNTLATERTIDFFNKYLK